MFDNPQASHTLGLELDAHSLKGVAISFVRGAPKLEAVFDYPVEITEGNVKPLYIDDQKKQLDDLIHKHLVATPMDAQDVLVRPLELKLTKEKDIDSVLIFQAEPILPFSADNAVVDKIILSQDKESSKLTIFAVRKDHLSHHLQLWNSLGIEPEVVTAAPLALALFAKHFATPQEPCYVLHMGLSRSLCSLIEDGKLVAAQSISGGLESLIQAYAKDAGKSFEDAKDEISKFNFNSLNEEAYPSLKAAFEILRLSVTRTIYALAKQVKGRDISLVLVVGEGAAIEGLSEVLCRPLNKTLLTLQDNPGFGMNAAELQKFALPIGEALSALPNCKDEINLRQGELGFPDRWKRLKKPILTYFMLCIGAALALMLFGKSYVKYQEAEVRKHYLDILNVMNKPYADFEKEFTAKYPSGRDLTPGEVVNVTELTPDELKSRLNFLEKEIQSTPQTYPLQPGIPLVSDVLAWLSTHANFVGKDGAPELQIESFSYTMAKRPDPTKKNDKYQVKVELEFSSPAPKMAREFHDALIGPNEIVDPKGEVKWSSNKDRYRTSFFLKDKTAYSTP